MILKMIAGFHHTCAVKCALDLDLFTAIAEGNNTVALLSERCAASYHGVESLCNYLAVHHLLLRKNGTYDLTEEARLYLDRRAEGYQGALINYLCLPELQSAWAQLTSAVQYGSSPMRRERSDRYLSVLEARATAKLRRPLAQRVAGLVAASVPTGTGEPFRVLNAGAMHGMFGVQLAAQTPLAQVWLSDTPTVLQVARETAAAEQQLQRVSFLPGEIFSIAPESNFHVVLVAFFLSAHDPTEALRVASRLYDLLLPGGLLVVVDDVLEDCMLALRALTPFNSVCPRISPGLAVSQNLNLLATTPGGRVYSASELQAILDKAAFESVTAQVVNGGVVFLARRPELPPSYSDSDPAMRG